MDSKLDRLLSDVAVIKAKVDLQSESMAELKAKLDPVFYHVNGVRWAFKIAVGVAGVVSCIAAAVSVLK